MCGPGPLGLDSCLWPLVGLAIIFTIFMVGFILAERGAAEADAEARRGPCDCCGQRPCVTAAALERCHQRRVDWQ